MTRYITKLKVNTTSTWRPNHDQLIALQSNCISQKIWILQRCEI